jgi:glyoxylase-like metal-dependent hydrolase (beta-lactamase superfamily II)
MEERCFGPVRFIPGQNNGKYPNCHSIYIEGAGVLIDPAADRDRLIRLKQESGAKAVWLSHWHEDHITHLDLFEDLATPKTMKEIVAAWIVYGRKREPEAFFAFAEEALMKKHLEVLMEQSLVSKKGNRYYRC